MVIRSEQPHDVDIVRSVNLRAFETRTEADLVDALRSQVEGIISLVAEEGRNVVGHILFSPVSLDSDRDARIMGLAPMAVLPEKQRQGVGAALIQEGLERCRALGREAVVVLGHPDYYPRFGFLPASRWGIHSEYDVPDDTFMALELTEGALDGRAGTIRYHPLFATA